MATLAQKQAELAQVKDALAAARLAQSYGQGDRNLQRAGVAELEAQVARIQRDIDSMTAVANGARSGLYSTAAWR